MFLKIALLFMMLTQLAHTEMPSQKIAVSLGYHIDPCQGPILLANLLGLFHKYGLEVSISPASGGEESSRQVAMKHAQIGITKSANHIVRVNTGLPLKKMGTLVGRPLEVLITRDTLTDLKDLRGKTLGFSTSNATFSILVLDKILAMQGLTRDDITLVAFQHGLMQAFLSGQVDAIFTATDPYETKMAEQFQMPIRVHTYESFGIPPYEQFIFFIHKDDEGKPYIEAFLRAVKEAIQTIKRDPMATWQQLCAGYPEMDTTLNHKIWLRLVEMFEANPEELNVEGLAKILEFLQHNKVDGKPVLDHQNTVITDIVIKTKNAPT
ncbi:MAG: ABC transporter substrate-binding protein [Alphaproteobacteria bacterium]|nr:ABC transporter substrate-binding protein [Alphaproteobacteria bacterium]